MISTVKLPLLGAAFAVSVVTGQQVYISAEGPSPRPSCTSCNYTTTPTYRFTPFSFTQTETYRMATSRPAPTTTHTYAPAYSALSSLVPNLSTTTWGNWEPRAANATAQATDAANPYGNAAWTSLWDEANLANFTEVPLYTTTVSPTPVPTSELILPPSDYFGPTDCYTFPEDFIFGVAGSAAQIEGAVAREGKSPSLMEILTPGRAKDYITNENYYLYKQDIERLASMGIKYYSFSIAWTRIVPFAMPGTPVNQEGLDHYSDLIDFVLEKGMIPTVTMLHFDTPLQFFASNTSQYTNTSLGYVNGAYQNETFVDAFVNYGKILLTHYADRVPIWFTFNEPLLYSANGVAIDHVIKAHAQVYHFYHDDIQGSGKMGIKFNDNFGVPKNPQNASDVEAANHFNEFQLGTFCNPIFLGIDYPEAFKMTIPDYVPLTAEDLAYIGNTSDFLGIDPYTATVVSQPAGGIAECAKGNSSALRPYCVVQETQNIFGWNIGYRSQSYVYITPTYFRTYMNYLYNTFRHPVLVSEFGFPVFGESEKLAVEDQLYDTPRSQYYLSFMTEILKCIHEDGVNIMGALAWSFADNWEFGDYSAQFGLQFVNRTTQERRYKKSLFDLVDFVSTRMKSD